MTTHKSDGLIIVLTVPAFYVQEVELLKYGQVAW